MIANTLTLMLQFDLQIEHLFLIKKLNDNGGTSKNFSVYNGFRLKELLIKKIVTLNGIFTEAYDLDPEVDTVELSFEGFWLAYLIKRYDLCKPK